MEEAADVIQTAISVVAKAFEDKGFFPMGRFTEICRRKLDKWENKQKKDQ